MCVNVVLTGANGFIGKRLVETLALNPEINLTAPVRSWVDVPDIKVFEMESFGPNTNWSEAVSNQDFVIHTAGYSSISKKMSLDEFYKVNVLATLELANQAALAGVKRFIFISSVKVNGETTSLGRPFTSKSEPNPQNHYSISKWKAEIGLKKIAKKTKMEIVIIRSPLVYGPNVKGNFLAMLNLIYKGVPLPFASIRNKRSFIALDNLVDLIITCIKHPRAANQTFLASDGQDVSTPELLEVFSKVSGLSIRLFPFPTSLLTFALTVIGKRSISQRLFYSLQVDIDSTCKILDWHPPLSLSEGLSKCLMD